MYCTTCKGPLDPNPYQGWYRCTRCGAWNAAQQVSPVGAPSVSAGDGAGFSPASQIPPPPRTPTPRAKEMIFAYQGSQAISRSIGIAFSLALFPALGAAYGIPGEVALLVDASTTQGTVTNVALDRSHKINRRPATKVEFRFKVGGQNYEESFHTIQAGALQPGSAIVVEYSSLYPGFARAKGYSYSFFGFAALGFLAMPVVGFALFLSAWRSHRRQIRAFVHGAATTGVITERTIDRSSRQGRRRPRVIRWSFTVGGASYGGILTHLDHALIDSLLPGPSVVVLYDPKNPRINTVWLG